MERIHSEGPANPNINTMNDYAVSYRRKTYGQPACISTPWGTPAFKTKQEAYRFAAYAITLAEVSELPDENGQPVTFEQVLEAVRNA